MTDIRDDAHAAAPSHEGRQSPWELSVGPPPDHWDDWVELDPKSWPEKVERHYRCVPTICFNCESACGLLAFVDKQTGRIQKFEGNPVHPGSRGRTCAKGPATINQVNDPERILVPLERVGARGAGEWREVTWEHALDTIGGRIRKALLEERHDEVVYHVGRPGEDHFVLRMLQAWGIDGHNSHTNVCSASARLGFSLWFGADRPSPDHTGAKFILLLSAHLETGHYFNPHAQRIIESKEHGAKIAVVDTRLSNTSTHAERWISPWPGSEPAMLLAVARQLLITDRVDHDFVRTWTNWRAWLEATEPGAEPTYERFVEKLKETYAEFTPEYAVEECKIPAGTVEYLADRIAEAGSRFASHLWRNTAAGNLGGWQSARALLFLHVLSGSVGTEGGLNPNSWDKAHPHPGHMPPPIKRWNERHWPKEWPLAHYEMSFLLPHLLREQDACIDTYFTRVYNPVWTNPDGCSWIEMFEEEGRIGCHVALTPTWNETAQWADFVLPMGIASERHDLMSQETHAGQWIGFRQPVGREFARLEGHEQGSTLGSNPGQVWEEAEFWIALTWRIDPDGSLGIRKWFESKEHPGQPISMDEYWADVFEHTPGLPAKASEAGMTPLEYMKRHGAYEVPYDGQKRYEAPDEQGLELEDGRKVKGWPTLSKRLEFFSPTMREWGFEGGVVPSYQRSQVHWSQLDLAAGERTLLPTFRLPTLIHTRSANAKWLTEISHTNPLWMHPEDAQIFGLETGDLVRVATRIGYFVPRVWVTEGIHPGIVACSHHVGRWRIHDKTGGRLASVRVALDHDGTESGGKFLFRQQGGVSPYTSADADTSQVHWSEAGVNQNLTFPVQPDPASGMHCWHQKVKIERALDGDRYGDVFVDTAKSREIYEEWKAMTRPAPGPGGLRRPLHMKRPLRPTDELYKL
jgi:anaerobic selenocysteine-containing dehydrogenase